MSDDHLTLDGTIIEAWASQKSFQKKGGDTDGEGREFRGERRTNQTHASTTDPDKRLYRRCMRRSGCALRIGPTREAAHKQSEQSTLKEFAAILGSLTRASLAHPNAAL